MLLNDTKPPLDEVVKHSGVKGMHWGQRKEPGYAKTADYYKIKSEHHNRNVALATGAAVVGAGIGIAILAKYGGLKLPKKVLSGVVEDGVKVSKTAKKTSDIVDGEVVSSSYVTYLNGSKAVKSLSIATWTKPLLAITSG